MPFSKGAIKRRMSTNKAHPGFKAAASGISRRQGISQDKANAILAASSRNASTGAKRRNPRLKRV